MPYALIVLVAVIALSGVFILVTDVGWWWKAFVASLLLISFVWRYGLFLRVALAVGLSLYFTCLKARSDVNG